MFTGVAESDGSHVMEGDGGIASKNNRGSYKSVL